MGQERWIGVQPPEGVATRTEGDAQVRDTDEPGDITHTDGRPMWTLRNQVPALQWTNEPPTVPGLYWHRSKDADGEPGVWGATVAQVVLCEGRLVIMGDELSAPVALADYLWSGPIAESQCSERAWDEFERLTPPASDPPSA